MNETTDWPLSALRERDAEITRLTAALRQIAAIAVKPGGTGQIARDALRVCKYG